MKKGLSILIGLVLLCGSAILVMVADRQGWLPGSASDKALIPDCPHGLSSGVCPFCDSTLIESMGQCVEHGVPEALCTKCNSALIVGFKAEGDWCAEHNIPESQCTLHNSGLPADQKQAEMTASQDTSIKLVYAAELPRTQRPPSEACEKNTLRIQFVSSEIAGNAGLEYVLVERRMITQTITCNAEVAYDGNRYARLSSRAPGVVQNVNKDLGQRVQAGDVLATIDSADLGTAKAEYLHAQVLVNLWTRNHSREQKLLERRIATEMEVLEAETKLAESKIAVSRATQKLRNFGLRDEQIHNVAEKKDTSSILPLTAPIAGIVVERSAVVGEVVDTSMSLFAITDTSLMWVMLDVYETDILDVRIGQAVMLEIEGLRGQRHGGRITWVSSSVDSHTRTLKVRAEVENRDGLLRAGMFGRGIVSIADRASLLVIPKSAVQWEGCCNVVFVRKSDVLFEPRKIWLGFETDGFFVVEKGLEQGEQIVTTGSFLLKTEILKGSIGAGCCPEV